MNNIRSYFYFVLLTLVVLIFCNSSTVHYHTITTKIISFCDTLNKDSGTLCAPHLKFGMPHSLYGEIVLFGYNTNYKTIGYYKQNSSEYFSLIEVKKKFKISDDFLLKMYNLIPIHNDTVLLISEVGACVLTKNKKLWYKAQNEIFPNGHYFTNQYFNTNSFEIIDNDKILVNIGGDDDKKADKKNEFDFRTIALLDFKIGKVELLPYYHSIEENSEANFKINDMKVYLLNSEIFLQYGNDSLIYKIDKNYNANLVMKSVVEFENGKIFLNDTLENFEKFNHVFGKTKVSQLFYIKYKDLYVQVRFVPIEIVRTTSRTVNPKFEVFLDIYNNKFEFIDSKKIDTDNKAAPIINFFNDKIYLRLPLNKKSYGTIEFMEIQII
jgi:hypothetical protein